MYPVRAEFVRAGRGSPPDLDSFLNAALTQRTGDDSEEFMRIRWTAHDQHISLVAFITASSAALAVSFGRSSLVSLTFRGQPLDAWILVYCGLGFHRH